LAGLCLSSGALTVFLAVQNFTLSWIHSVERIEWQEDWRIASGLLVLTDSRVKGHGAGMEPSSGAAFDGTWWHSQPERTLGELVLAQYKGVADWQLCVETRCRSIGTYFSALDRSHPVRLMPCESAAGPGRH